MEILLSLIKIMNDGQDELIPSSFVTVLQRKLLASSAVQELPKSMDL